MKEILIDNNVVCVYVKPDQNLGVVQWKDLSTLTEYQDAFLSMLAYAQKNRNIYYVLSDIRSQGTVGPDKRKWFETTALPQAVECGLQKAAIVMDGSPFKMYYANLLLDFSKKKFGIPLKLFKSIEDATAFFKVEQLEHSAYFDFAQ